MKKATNRILSFLTAFAMVIGVLVAPFTSANAAEETTETVTLHKILQSKDNLNAKDKEKKDVFPGHKGLDDTEYNGNKIQDIGSYFGTGSEEIKGVYFAFKYNDGENKGKYVTIKEEEGKDPVYGVADSLDAELEEGVKLLAGETEDKGIAFNTKGLKGDFLIEEIHEESSYVGKDGETLTDMKAVPVDITLPLVNNDGVVKEAHVYPKNTEEKPQIDKNFKYGKGEAKLAGEKESADGAEETVGANYDNYSKEKEKVTSELGKKIPYEVKTKIPAKAKYKKLVWDDQMQEGLVYNKDLEISGLEGLVKGTDYNLYETNRGFRLVFTTDGLTKVENAAANGEVELTLTYSAHLDGTVKPDQVKENNVTFDYSNKPGFENEPTETKPSEGKITVEKSWAADGKEITEADRHVKAVFTLQEQQEDGSWKDVQEKEVGYKEGFTETFEGLDDTKTYRVVESVSGYEPEYQKVDENGKIVIVNKIDNDNPKTLKPTNPKVVNGGKKFVKTNQEGTERLAGAEFYVTNAAGEYLVPSAPADIEAVKTAKDALDKAVEAYNALSEEQQKGEEGKTAKALVDEKQKAYNEAVFANSNKYEFKAKDEKGNIPAEAVVLTSDENGKFEITGLAYGDYKLEEKTAPKDYAKLQEPVEFKVEKGSYSTKDVDIKYETTDTENNAKKVPNKKVTIPQTGGIGSLIFIVAGLAIMGLAFVMKRRNAVEA
ncbi:pilin N-terminal domain-containing protein [Anaerococcus urinomassiliensis]|uniref:pilin N-terminal domain-containing protein n=1 Tax=Anaerococcus urinomassiliensis TaxID=1745712 RepID=UPI00093A149F|nr:pilin N-terminal domain-containing protein [Anaerococcus urinomassiliensis]